MVDMHRPEVHIAGLPPPGRRAIVWAPADDAHEGAGHKKRQDEGNQAAQKRQSAAVDNVMLQPIEHLKKVTPTDECRSAASLQRCPAVR